MQAIAPQLPSTKRARRALAGAVVTAITIFVMQSGAQADAPAEQQMCLDAATPNRQKIAACSFVLAGAAPTEPTELARIYLARGNAYLFLRDYDHALADLNIATRVAPTAPGPHNSRGLVFRYQKQFEHAIAEFDEAIRLNAKDAVALTNRGDAYRDQGHFDRALQDYDSAIAIDPKRINAYFGRAVTLQQKANSDFDAFLDEGRYEELAIAEYGKVLQIAPRTANALGNRGLLYRTLRKYDLAIADFTQAIEMNPANVTYLRNRAMTYRMMRRFDLAIADYRKALTLTQDDAGRNLIVRFLAELGVVV